MRSSKWTSKAFPIQRRSWFDGEVGGAREESLHCRIRLERKRPGRNGLINSLIDWLITCLPDWFLDWLSLHRRIRLKLKDTSRSEWNDFQNGSIVRLLAGRLIDWYIFIFIKRLIDWLPACLIACLINCLPDSSIACLIDCLPACLIDFLIDRLVGWLVGWLIFSLVDFLGLLIDSSYVWLISEMNPSLTDWLIDPVIVIRAGTPVLGMIREVRMRCS